MMNYAKLRDELIKQNGGENIVSCQHGDLIIHDKVQWLNRTGVFLFPEHFPPGPESFREVAALELFHKPSKKLKLSAVVKGSKGDWFCDLADAAIGKFDEPVNGKRILCPNGSLAVNNSDETTALIVKEISRRLEDAQITEAAKAVLEFLKAPDNLWVQKVTRWYVHVGILPAALAFKEDQERKKLERLNKMAIKFANVTPGKKSVSSKIGKSSQITKEEIVAIAKQHCSGERLERILNDLENPVIVKNFQKLKDRNDIPMMIDLLLV
jgi:hypothetical protein